MAMKQFTSKGMKHTLSKGTDVFDASSGEAYPGPLPCSPVGVTGVKPTAGEHGNGPG
jgi:hypothetical protein